MNSLESDMGMELLLIHNINDAQKGLIAYLSSSTFCDLHNLILT